jgi:hypothetical protein
MLFWTREKADDGRPEAHSGLGVQNLQIEAESGQ